MSDIYNESDNGNTSVSNLFIDEYLTEANDAQIKVYLYLLRMTAARRATSISDMADKFNHTEKDVCRALKYWEKKGLLSLAYDAMGTIIGIQVFNSPRSVAPSYPIVNMTTGPIFATGPMFPISSLEQPYVAYTVPNQQQISTPVVNEEQKDTFEKPVYSADDLLRFKQREETSALIFIAEQYLKRTLKPSDIQSLLFLTDRLGFSVDMIDYLLQYCVGKEKNKFSYIERVAIAWAEKGISTPEEAKAESSAYDSNVYSVMKALGKSSVPTEVEVAYIQKWRNEFGFSTDIILEACNRTVLATDKGRFKYANKILESWNHSGVSTMSDISKCDAEHKNVSGAPRATTSTTFHQFNQKSDYDMKHLEQLLLKK